MVKRKYRFLTIIFLLSILCFSGLAQDNKTKISVAPDGSKYMVHKVKPGETIFGICREFKVDSRDLIKMNPGLEKGLKAGVDLKIPVLEEKPIAAPVAKPKEPTFIVHEIQRKETPYFVSKKYRISIDDIYKYNPGLKKFKKGEKIRIPVLGKETGTATRDAVENVKVTVPPVEEKSTMVEHKVKPDETLYSISRLYNCPVSQILSLNPGSANLRIGMVLQIPGKSANAVVVDEKSASEYSYYTVEAGETLFGLTKKFNISEGELKKLNPDLANGLKTGSQLKVPAEKTAGLELKNEKADNQPNEVKPVHLATSEITDPKEVVVVEVPEGCRPANKGSFFFDTYHVGLLLPLYLEANDSMNYRAVPVDTFLTELVEEEEAEIDTVEREFSPESQAWKFYRNSENFLHFYEGVLLAVDSMRSRGMDVKLHVYDTQQDVKIIHRLLSTDEFLNLDLIIGPVYSHLQKPVSDFAAKNRIPMVSPLLLESKLAETNPYYFQVYPSLDFMLERTANYIANKYSNSNFIILQSGAPSETDQKLIDLCREKLTANNNRAVLKTYDIGSRGGGGLKEILSESKENVFLIPAYNDNPAYDEGEVSVAVSNINNNANNYNITVVGDSRFSQFDAVSLEQYHNVNLKFFYPYWTNYSSPSTAWFYQKFHNYFKTEPNQFSTQGYDVAFYFLNALYSYGKNFYDCLPYFRPGQIQGNYRFEKVSKFGGYMNHGVSLISYEKDYTVVKEKTEPEIRFINK